MSCMEIRLPGEVSTELVGLGTKEVLEFLLLVKEKQQDNAEKNIVFHEQRVDKYVELRDKLDNEMDEIRDILRDTSWITEDPEDDELDLGNL